MRKLVLTAFLLTIPLLELPARSGDIKEADYPNRYQVVDTTQAEKLVVEKSCSLTLRDQAKTNVAISVWKKSYGACPTVDGGKIYHGRENQKKNEIELVIPVGENKARVETWQIVGTSNINPDKGPS